MAEYCEDLNFAEVAVNNRCIGVCLTHLASPKDPSARRGAARLLAAISQNYAPIQKKTIHTLRLLLKLANDEQDQGALKAQLAAISAISRVSRDSIKKFFDENGQALLATLVKKDLTVQVLNKVMFFAIR